MTSPTSPSPARPLAKPAYEITADDDAYQVHVYLPGVERADASITLEEGTLTITGRRRAALPADWRPLHRELRDHDYELRLELNVPVAEDRITARSEDGVLTVRLPIADRAKPRTIAID